MSKSIIIKTILFLPLRVLNRLFEILSMLDSRLVKFHRDELVNYINRQVSEINHITNDNKSINLSLFTPNGITLYRANTFSIKEPETLEWIEEFGVNDAILIDVGANVGLYSIYHALVNNSKAIAFEPSFTNLRLLVKNININQCQNLISVMSNPLSNSLSMNKFIYGSLEEGDALSSFGVKFGYDGNEINEELSINVLGMSLDWILENKFIENSPYFVKIDVDGIEHIILEGAEKTLLSSNCKSVLVEVNENFKDQAIAVKKQMEAFGFILKNKVYSDLSANSEKFNATSNQIWVKNN